MNERINEEVWGIERGGAGNLARRLSFLRVRDLPTWTPETAGEVEQAKAQFDREAIQDHEEAKRFARMPGVTQQIRSEVSAKDGAKGGRPPSKVRELVRAEFDRPVGWQKGQNGSFSNVRRGLHQIGGLNSAGDKSADDMIKAAYVSEKKSRSK